MPRAQAFPWALGVLRDAEVTLRMEVLPGRGAPQEAARRTQPPCGGGASTPPDGGEQGPQARPVVGCGQGLCEPGCDPERGPGSLPAPPAQPCPRGPSPPHPSLLGSLPAGLWGPEVSSLTEALTSANVRLGSPGFQGLCKLPEAPGTAQGLPQSLSVKQAVRATSPWG